MSAEQHSRTVLHRRVVPWLVVAGALVAYLVTLNRWITMSNAALVMQATGWSDSLPVYQPLQYLLTLPLHWLPGSWTPVVLNALNAVLAALTLGLLAHSVMLIPQDRTRNQRLRERSRGGLLSIPHAWVPPVLAVLVCGLELTFWRNAISATGEMLDLLIFACLIYCLLRYRISKNDRWLFTFTALYGVGAANNYALIGFFPAFLVAFIWIKGFSILNTRFLLKSIGLGLVGLCAYLILPLAHTLSDLSDATFWQVLKANLLTQKQILFGVPRYYLLVLCLPSLMPVFLIGIRWSSTVGDTNAFSVLLREFMFYVIHLGFFVVCIVVAFDPHFSPYVWSRTEGGLPLPFLTFYYLGALAVGYCAGYLMLVFGRPPAAGPSHPTSSLGKFVNPLLVSLVWVALIAVPVGLLYTNLKQVLAENSPALRNYAELLVKSLPDVRGVALSDDPQRLLLARGELARTGRANQWLVLNTQLLGFAGYNRYLHRTHPDIWPQLPNPYPADNTVAQPWLVQTIAQVAKKMPVYYLHPSFGYYFEAMYAKPSGLTYHLLRYPNRDTLVPPPLTAEEIAKEQNFWGQIEKPVLEPLATRVSEQEPNAEAAGFLYSRAINWWGVQLQRRDRLKQAAAAFELATNVNPDNLVASTNLAFNALLQRGSTYAASLPEAIEDTFGNSRSWDQTMKDFGPFDEPRYCYRAGLTFFGGKLIRQAGQEFLRSIQLQPNSLLPRLMLTQLYIVSQHPTNALNEIGQIRNLSTLDLTRSNRVELACLEIAARGQLGQSNAVEQVIADTYAQGPKDPNTLASLTEVRISQNRIEDALKLNDQLLQLRPNDSQALLNKSALLIQTTNRVKEAIPILDQLLAQNGKHDKARLNRAIANLKLGNYDAARRDYEALMGSYTNLFYLYYGLGEIGYHTTNRDMALRNYQLYLKYAPQGTAEATQVEARIKELEGNP